MTKVRKKKKSHLTPATQTWILFFLPIAWVLIVFLSPLGFVPVPWPDDSAFYFVAKELFQWPPRWVMLPQSPFEPTYRIFNFNTMPLYPVLIGIGKWFGIDGSHLLKIWPLSAWALSMSLVTVTLFRAGLPFLVTCLFGLVFALDPALRWASVIVRPESLIGLFGVCLILGLTFGFPQRWKKKGIWDPVAALLALSAYAHFNAVHLVFPVLVVYFFRPKRLLEIGLTTIGYLFPWILAVAVYPHLFLHQMQLQWSRLAVPNSWLDSPTQMILSLFDTMGSPVGWHPFIHLASAALWVVLLFICGGFVFIFARFVLRKEEPSSTGCPNATVLLPSLAWVLSACWLWHTKPEVWFKFYIHLSLWTALGIFLWWCHQSRKVLSPLWLRSTTALCSATGAVFFVVNAEQAVRLSESESWNWKTYHSWIDCIDQQLTAYEKSRSVHAPLVLRSSDSSKSSRNLDQTKPSFEVWFPTFPDATIELSIRHPDWELTRTNDFHSRKDLALKHAHAVDAVVVTEMINLTERWISGPLKEHSEVKSLWMNWQGYYLHELERTAGWKPNRYLCQRGRWIAFLHFPQPPSTHSKALPE